MAYFLKINNTKYGVYLQISKTVYNKETKTSSNKAYKKIGYVKTLIEKGIANPIEHFQKEVDKLNKLEKEIKAKEKIALIEENPIKNIGYFLLKAMCNTLNLDEQLKWMNYKSGFHFDIAEMLKALVFSRVVYPCSKLKTLEEVLPSLFEKYEFSLGQCYDGLENIGYRYEDYIEILNYSIEQKCLKNTEHTYFDCTNYYFEIDYEKDDKQKGPSKENRPNPIIGQALLLDGDGIPLGMKMYPGNESEQPKIRELIKEIKNRNNITGRTIQVADKGLNSGENIYAALKESDGYIFSQSVAKLNENELDYVLDQKGFTNVYDKNGEVKYKYKYCIDEYPIKFTYKGKKITKTTKQKRVITFNSSLANKKCREIDKLVNKAIQLSNSQLKKNEYGESSKYIDFVNDNGEISNIKINYEKINKDKAIAGYNILITSELDMHPEEIYKIYRNLWRIEESFRVLKSQLDSRPVYLQDRNEIYGHFLVCYYAITLLRLIQVKVFDDKFSINNIVDFCRSIEVCKMETNYRNLTRRSDLVIKFSNLLNLPTNHLFLSEKEINKLFTSKLKM